MTVTCYACKALIYVEDKQVNWLVCACGCRCFGWDDHSSNIKPTKSDRPITMVAA